MKRQLRGLDEDFDVAVYAHTHKPRIARDESGRLHINPGEAGGWSFGRPTIAVLETESFEVDLIDLQQIESD